MGAYGRNHPRRPRRILTALARMSQCFLCGARLLPVRPTLCPPPRPLLFMLPLTRGGDLVILEETCRVSPCRA